MLPDQASLAIYQGDDYAAFVTITNADGAETNLTGFSAKSQIRRGPADDVTEVIEIETSISLPNTINLVLPNASTTPMTGKYVWDLEVIDPDGLITTVLAGEVFVTAEITR